MLHASSTAVLPLALDRYVNYRTNCLSVKNLEELVITKIHSLNKSVAPSVHPQNLTSETVPPICADITGLQSFGYHFSGSVSNTGVLINP
jgi:hypothetical protein